MHELEVAYSTAFVHDHFIYVCEETSRIGGNGNDVQYVGSLSRPRKVDNMLR